MRHIQVGLVCLGRFGSSLVRNLDQIKSQSPIHLRILDRDSERITLLKEQYDDAMIVDIEDANQEDLQKLFDKLDVLIIAIGENTLPVLLLAHMAIEISQSQTKPMKILCRAHNETTRKILQKLGINESDIFAPEEEAALSFAKRIAHPNSIDALPLDLKQALIQISTPEKWQDKPLGKLEIRKKQGANLLCLMKNGHPDVVLTPNKDTILEKGDQLVILGPPDELQKIEQQKI